MSESKRLTRRQCLQTVAASTALAVSTSWARDTTPIAWQRQVGVTVGSFMRHLTVEPTSGKLRLLDLPRLMRDELGMRIIDLMTATFASHEPRYVDALRNAAEKHGCILTNLKMNWPGLDLGSHDDALRARSLATFKRSIDTAARLGVRWVRPAPAAKKSDPARLAAGLRELIAYAAPYQITLLVENNGWMRDDPDSIVTLLQAVGDGIAAAPDTGNWTDAARYAGLAKSFPAAVTCDFKAFQLTDTGEHPPYDLERCFRIGWECGFRGPWCLEHFHETLPGLLRGMVTLRERLERWMQAAG